MKPKRRKPGPKPSGATERLHIRVTPEQKAEWQAAADEDKRTLSDWVGVVLDWAREHWKDRRR